MSEHDAGYRFTSDLFDIEEGEDEEVNPRMYGRQLAIWLRERLVQRGRRIDFVCAEDWGRCIMCTNNDFILWVGVGNQTDYESAKPGDPPPLKTEVIWHCFVVAEVPFWKRLFQKPNTSAAVAELDADLQAILESEPRILLEPEL